MAVARSFGGVAMWSYVEIPLQAAMLMQRRAQAKAPAVAYWLRGVLDDSGSRV